MTARSLKSRIRLGLLALSLSLAVGLAAGCGRAAAPPEIGDPRGTMPAPQGTDIEWTQPDLPDGELRLFVERYQFRPEPGLELLTLGDSIYALVRWGEKRTGGYSVQVTGVVDTGPQVIILAKLLAPGPNDVVTQAVTYPQDFIRFAKTDKPVGLSADGAEKWTIRAEDQPRIAVTSVSLSGTTATVEGWVRLPEGADPSVVQLELEDGHDVLATRTVPLTEPQSAEDRAANRQPFSLRFDFDRPTNPSGTVILYFKAEDGGRDGLVLVPVTFE